MTDARRNALLKSLAECQEPITGTSLAQKFNVSRQAIVQDIAILRASGYPIIAASNGYFIQKINYEKLARIIPSKHTGLDRMEEELKIIVDYGARLLNISVKHPIYGDIICPLIIASREDIRDFMERVKTNQATPLSALTEGNHYHLIEVDSEVAFLKIVEKLKKEGFTD